MLFNDFDMLISKIKKHEKIILMQHNAPQYQIYFKYVFDIVVTFTVAVLKIRFKKSYKL